MSHIIPELAIVKDPHAVITAAHAGVLTATADASAFSPIPNRAAAPLMGGGGIALLVSGVLAAFLPTSDAGQCLLGGALALAMLSIAGGMIGVRAARRV